MNLHHIGLIVRNLEASGKFYSDSLGMIPLGPAVRDDIQRVRVQFWMCERDGTSVELIEPLDGDSPVAPLLSKGGGFAHLCFAVENIETALRQGVEKGAIVIQRPMRAQAFNQRRIAFLCYREIGVVEFVESES